MDVPGAVTAKEATGEELERFLIDDDPKRFFQVRVQLPHREKMELVMFLKNNIDVIAWDPYEAPRVDPSFIFYHLNVNPAIIPRRQLPRRSSKEHAEAVKEEVLKLKRAGALKEVFYSEWLVHTVVVKKKNGKWRVCVDFTDLNKACPKDSFPMPRIDQLVNATIGHPRISFLDAFQGYQPLALDDQEKTAFITPTRNYHYKVMPFGLKNAEATYQRMMTRMFESQLGKTTEVYVDDMVVKSETVLMHVKDLDDTFQTFRKYKLCLNASKCSFGVGSSKFLCYMVTHRGIEVNPAQIKAIQGLKPPQNPKEVQKLTGMTAALSRFISRSADRCRPFFQLLNKWKGFEWIEECDLAINDLVISAQMSGHSNVLKPIGCCLHTPIPISVFEFAAGGFLANRIYVSRVTERQHQPMGWERRLKIARQIAHVISYLHTAFPRPVIHMAINMHCILLDEHDVPKLSNFYFSVSIPEGEADVEGFDGFRCFGFCPPEFKATGKVTEKVYVYDFGRFLLELLTGENSLNITRFTIDKDSSLVAYIHNHAQGSCINEIVDPAILAKDGEGGASLEHQLQAVLDLALTCTEEDPQTRPTMVDITKQLRRIERFTQTGEELGGNLQNLKLLESVEEHASASLKRNASSDEIQAVNEASERPLEV
ncbi:hypothetical protein CMV_018877 [Castanea mollissima]|uniref:Protein kinase domain-containing protein n=1 Tax=Castanea mollissima TaxID=60419 RepID=A0A8J4VNB4_9ROSI|nr:hypothetical protein CMV_018877 [Castanea mollissima]